MKLGETVINSHTTGISGDSRHDCVIEVYYAEQLGLFQYHPHVRYYNAKGTLSAKIQTLFVTLDDIHQARRHVMMQLANKNDPLHRWVEILIPLRSQTGDGYAIFGAYVDHPSVTAPSMLKRKVQLALGRWRDTSREGRDFSIVENPTIRDLAGKITNLSLRRNLEMFGVRYPFIEIESRNESTRDQWDFDSPLVPISK